MKMFIVILFASASLASLLPTSRADAVKEVNMTNTFDIKSWDESPYLEFKSGTKHSRAKVVKEYSGELIGKGHLEYLMAYNDSGAAYFTGIEHFEGRLGDRKGTFSMVHEGTFSEGSVTSTFRILGGSQSGELVKLTGEGGYKTGHSMSVNFDFTHAFGD